MMKRLKRQVMAQMLIGFLLGRAAIGDYAPFGAAYFLAGYLQGTNLLALGLSVGLGMFSVLSPEMTARYGAAMLAVVILSDLMEENEKKLEHWQALLTMLLVLGLLSVVQYCILPCVLKDLLWIMAELVLVLVGTEVFYYGEDLLYTMGKDRGERETYAQDVMRHRLQEVSGALLELSGALERQTGQKLTMSGQDMRRLMRNMSEQICESCPNKDYCMGQVAVNRPENIGPMLMAGENGRLYLEQMPSEFIEECVHPEWFLRETNLQLQMERVIMSYQNKLSANRRILADQMEQVGLLMKSMSQAFGSWRPLPERMEQEIRSELARIRVRVQEVFLYQDQEKHIRLHLTAATLRGRLVTAKETADALSGLLGRGLLPAPHCHHVIPGRMTEIVFVEDTPYYAMTGVARMAKTGEVVSGDAFTCQPLSNGELLLALSDGMGSGSPALGESSTVMELLEQMTEAGFTREAALRLINSLYMPEGDQTSFATADVVVVDLFKGTCQFTKNGASATWIRRCEGVERVEGQALPVGVTSSAPSYLDKKRLFPGDYVIMVTDGVVDAFPGREQELEELLDQNRIINPQELAKWLLEEALEQDEGRAGDDMSIMVAAIWEREAAIQYNRQKHRIRKRTQDYETEAMVSQG